MKKKSTIKLDWLGSVECMDQPTEHQRELIDKFIKEQTEQVKKASPKSRLSFTCYPSENQNDVLVIIEELGLYDFDEYIKSIPVDDVGVWKNISVVIIS